MMVALVDDFFLNAADGDVSRLNCSEIERYAQEKGMSVKAYDLRRDGKVRLRIKQLQDEAEKTKADTLSESYKTLDVDGLIRNCRDADELVEKVVELDRYWKCVYAGAVQKDEQIRKLRDEIGRFQEDDRVQASDARKLLEERGMLMAKNRQLTKENAALRRVINNYVYPAIAEHLLKEEGLAVTPKEGIDISRINELVEGSIPEALKQNPATPKRAGGAKGSILISQMRKAAFSDGE